MKETNNELEKLLGKTESSKLEEVLEKLQQSLRNMIKSESKLKRL
jgi:hypothetical protein